MPLKEKLKDRQTQFLKITVTCAPFQSNFLPDTFPYWGECGRAREFNDLIVSFRLPLAVLNLLVLASLTIRRSHLVWEAESTARSQ